jgi:hypothetical protein
MPSSLSAPPSQGITAENSSQKRSSFAVSEQGRRPGFSTLLELAHSVPWLARAIWWRFYERRLLYPVNAEIQLHVVIEQRARPENRIFLSGDRYDLFGQPLAVFDWSVDKEDERNLTNATDLFLETWKKTSFSALATIRRRPPGEAEAKLALGGGVYHPGGTVRMGRTPAIGVVNSDLSAFQVANMHVISCHLSNWRRRKSHYDATDACVPVGGSYCQKIPKNCDLMRSRPVLERIVRLTARESHHFSC